jgi:hypothetical protein
MPNKSCKNEFVVNVMQDADMYFKPPYVFPLFFAELWNTLVDNTVHSSVQVFRKWGCICKVGVHLHHENTMRRCTLNCTVNRYTCNYEFVRNQSLF